MIIIGNAKEKTLLDLNVNLGFSGESKLYASFRGVYFKGVAC